MPLRSDRRELRKASSSAGVAVDLLDMAGVFVVNGIASGYCHGMARFTASRHSYRLPVRQTRRRRRRRRRCQCSLSRSPSTFAEHRRNANALRAIAPFSSEAGNEQHLFLPPVTSPIDACLCYNRKK